MMETPDKYLRFVNRNDDKKYYIYEYVRGNGDMSIYRRGKVVGKRTVFENEFTSSMPLSTLKFMLHKGLKFQSFETLDELEAELFMEAFEDF